MTESSFERFWKAYPSSPRKGGKIDCKKRWDRYECEKDLDLILKHLAYMATTEMWIKGNGAFIPMPATYLNQRRWDGAEIPEIKPQVNVLKVIEEENKKAISMPADIKAKLDAIRGRA